MTANGIYAIGTLASWAGAILILNGLWQLAKLLSRAPDVDHNKALGKSVFGLGVGAICIVVAVLLLDLPKQEGASGWRIPLVWFVLPFVGWASVVCASATVVRLVQSAFALNQDERAERLKAAGIWAVAALLFLWLWSKEKFDSGVIKGVLAMQPTTAIAIGAFLLAAFLAMIWTGRQTRTRGYAKALVTHATLIAGSIIFGIPFAFLLVTSFKEDRDMASSSGIVWVPRVQKTVEYDDPKKPLFEGTYEGKSVQGEVIETRADGTVKVDIFKPMSLRGLTFESTKDSLKPIPKLIPIVRGTYNGKTVEGKVIEDLEDGRRVVSITTPVEMKDTTFTAEPADIEPVREIGLKWQNYPDALDFLPPETNRGLVYLKNSLLLVVLNVLGTILSSAIVAYAFSRLKFPGKNALFVVMLSTMMLPAAVTLLPQFLIFRSLGWIDTLYPLWVPAFFASAFNVFLLRQFFLTIPMELEDAAKIDGSSYLNTFWKVMLPLIKPALAVIAIWTFMGAWNNFMGPLIYINSPENMPVSYALQLYNTDRSGEPGLLMAFVMLAMLPVLLVFFFAQRYFIEGVTLSGLGGR